MKKIDLTGKRFNKLVVLREGKKSNTGIIRWICRCDCGNESLVIGNQLKNGKTKSCGCLKNRLQRENLLGKKFGKLTVIKKGTKTGSGQVRWICICDCGSRKEVEVLAANLKKGHTTGCGCRRNHDKKIDLTGKKINMLTVIRQDGYNKSGQANWLCKCECGDFTTVDGYRLRRGELKSCGCLLGGKHGLRKHPLYHIWKDMRYRCHSENSKANTYRENNIVVCENWRNDPSTFIRWAENNGYKKGLQIDRINNDGNYEPSNCRFVTNRENTLNKTRLRSDNKTGFVGVSKKNNRFIARVARYGKLYHVGSFSNAKIAAMERDLFIMENFPEDGYMLNFVK